MKRFLIVILSTLLVGFQAFAKPVGFVGMGKQFEKKKSLFLYKKDQKEEEEVDELPVNEGFEKAIYGYDPTKKEWKQVTDFPLLPQAYSVSFRWGHRLYIGLGLEPGQWEKQKGEKKEQYLKGQYNPTLHCYDLTQKKWSKKARFPGKKERQSASFALNGKGYVGLPHNLKKGTTKEFYCFSPTQNKWNKVASFPGKPRQRVISASGYVGLGVDQEYKHYQDIYRYNPSNNRWKKIPPFPGEARCGAVSFVINGKLYVGLGAQIPKVEKIEEKEEKEESEETEKKDKSTTKKKEEPTEPKAEKKTDTKKEDKKSLKKKSEKKPPVDSNKAEKKAINPLSEIYKEEKKKPKQPTYYKDFYCYNPTTRQWKKTAPFPADSRKDAVAFVSGGKAYVGLGANKTYGQYAGFYCFNPSKNSWERIAPFPGSSLEGTFVSK